MCGCIFKAKRLFLALLLCIGCTAVSNPASAVVCFLPDAEGCGDNGINYTPVICDGTNNFTQDLCNTTADKYSSKERHYFCVEEGTGCYVLDSTPCFESIDYDDCPGCLNSPKDEQYNCITTIQGFTRHVCSDKGISSEERDSRTQYLCREKKYKQEGCDTFDLSEAEKNEKEATGDFICSECIKDMYTSDYDGNWNRTGDGDTVYSCRGKVACNQTESDCTADQKFVADGTTDEYQQACGVCQDKVPCTKVESDCGSDEKFIADGTTDDYNHTCGKCETKIKCSKVASDCTGEQTFVKDGTTDDYNHECGTCKEPDKKTCTQLDLKTASECNSATQKFNSTRTDDYGTECGSCVAKKTCNNLGYKAESECKTSNQKFTAASPAVKDDYGTVCGSCGNKKTCKDMGYKTAAEASANERFSGNNVTDDYNTPCGTLELKKCSEINAAYKIAGNCSSDETFAGNGTKGKDGDCGKCNLKTCAGITSGSTTKNKCTEACYTGFNPNGKTGSDGACGVCAAQCPSGYTKDLSSCGTKDGYVLTHKAASCTHSVVCGKCEECKLNSCSGYTYTTLSDYANSESCDRGCNQGKKYRCKSGYTYSNGKCVKACTYTYFEATPSNTCGTTGNLDRNESCKTSTCCFKNLSRVESIDRGSGSPSVMPIYNKISNKSDSCVRDGTTYYETLCQGTPEDRCPSSKAFTPNGCVSSGYNHGYEVKGTRWGTCGCNTANGEYDTIDTCRNKTGTGCASTGGCYRTCKSLGYYSTEADCKNTNYKVTCDKIADCYKRTMQGFLIKYETGEKRRWHCDPRNANSYNIEISAFLTDVEKNSKSGLEQSGNYSQTVDGIRYQELPDDTSKGYQYKAGTYYLCYRGGRGVGLSVRSVRLLKQADYNTEFYSDVCFSGNPSSAGYWGSKKCVAQDYSGGTYACKKVTFTAGKIYKIRFDYNYGKEGWTYDMGTCNQY